MFRKPNWKLLISLVTFTKPIWAELFPQERARVLALLLECVEFDAEFGEVEITFRPGGPRAVNGRSTEESR